MATLKHIGTKIKSTKNIAKITNALEVVATIKLQKIKKDTEAFKKYVLAILGIASEVFAYNNTLPEGNSSKKNLHIIIGSDKGLCGPINAKLCKEVVEYLATHDKHIDIITVGKKIKTFFAKTKYPIVESLTISDSISADEMEVLHALLEQALVSKRYNAIIVHFTYFKNILKQIPTNLLVYPFTQEAFAEFMASIELSTDNIKAASREYSFEPSHKAVKENLLNIMSKVMMHGAILHHKTSEFAARMLAMKSSKDNATQIIQDLTVQYNKIRQDTITKEIVEIVGAKAVVDL